MHRHSLSTSQESYKDQPVNAVKEKGRGLLRELYEAHKYTQWEKIQSFIVLQEVVPIEPLGIKG
jgi:hypothetical protein